MCSPFIYATARQNSEIFFSLPESGRSSAQRENFRHRLEDKSQKKAVMGELFAADIDRNPSVRRDTIAVHNSKLHVQLF